MSSHDKRRCYVGTLEEYVIWLEKEMKGFGGNPIAMKKILKHKGMACRSLRVSRQCNRLRPWWIDYRVSRQCWLISKTKRTNFTNRSKPKKKRLVCRGSSSRAPILTNLSQALELQALLDQEERHGQDAGLFDPMTSSAPSRAVMSGPFTSEPIQSQPQFRPQLSASQLQGYEYWISNADR